MMRLPVINSRPLHILQAFRRGPMTVWQGIEAHGPFPSRHCPDGLEHSAILALYCDLVSRGYLVQEGILYRLSVQAQQALEAKDSKDQIFIGSVATPRIVRSLGEFKTEQLAAYTGRYVRL